MKVSDGPVTLELDQQQGDELSYLRWRDYHREYPSGQRVVRVHQLAMIAWSDDPDAPYKVFSNGQFEVHHCDGETLHNSEMNLELKSHVDHWNGHVNETGNGRRAADD